MVKPGTAPSILDEIQDADDERASRKLARMRGQIDELRRELKATEQERDDAEKIAAVALAAVKARPVKPQRKPKTKGRRRAEAWLLLSDHHYGKAIDWEEVGESNHYRPHLAVERLESLAVGLAWQLDNWQSEPGYDIQRLNVALIGDLIENTLHEENHYSNTMTPTEETTFAITHLGDLLAKIGTMCSSVRCVGVVGNHGRTTRRMPAKGRARQSYESVVYRELQRRFTSYEWVVPNSIEAIVKCFDFDVRNIHGDTITAGNAQGGPIAAVARNVKDMQAARYCHATNMGHFHQFLNGPGFVVNNSLCGYDEYAKTLHRATFSPPSQVAYLIDERDGLTMPRQIRVYDSEQRRRDAATR